MKIFKTLCFFGIHNWQITKWCTYKHRNNKYPPTILVEEGFNRTCKRCNKEQQLQKPEKYDPVAYVWRDLKKKN